MNRWLQTKYYTCPACGTRYLHDTAYRHVLFECPQRPAPKNRIVTSDGVRARSLPRATADGAVAIGPEGFSCGPAGLNSRP